LQLLCSAAKADKGRIKTLEQELAEFKARAVLAEQEKVDMQARLEHLQAYTCGTYTIDGVIRVFRHRAFSGDACDRLQLYCRVNTLAARHHGFLLERCQCSNEARGV
jgi:hypothetical protein